MKPHEGTTQKIERDYLKNWKFIHKKQDKLQFLKRRLKTPSDILSDTQKYFLRGMIGLIEEKFTNATEAFEKVIALDENYAFPWDGLGNVYAKQNDYYRAIEAYQKALELDYAFAFPWNGLGNIYAEMDDNNRAVEAYQRAIELDGTFAFPWDGLGNIYAGQNAYDRAIEAYQKAIELDDAFAFPWNGLGTIYIEQKNYDRAIEAFIKAIELDDTYAYAHFGLGTAYEKQKNYAKAFKSFLKCKALLVDQGENYWAVIAQEAANRLKNKLAAGQQLKKDLDDKVTQVLKTTQTLRIDETAFSNKELFLTFIKEHPAVASNRNRLKVLRRWNSYTPIIADNFHISKGGGYFIQIGKKGIVIDPGFNFIENFKGAGHFFKEIDAVLVTHAHNDHTADLESILTLLYKYNETIKGDPDIPSHTSRGNQSIRDELGTKLDRQPSSKEIDEAFEASGRKKKIDIYLTKSTFKKYSGMFDLFKTQYYCVHIIEKDDHKFVCGLDMRVLGAKHFDIISDNDSVGFAFEFRNCVVVYTGDTGWNDTIDRMYETLKRDYDSKGKRVDVLIAHLGGFKSYETDYFDAERRTNSFYKNHLGRIGLVRINEVLQPRICFISEFGEEMKAHRIPIAKVFNDTFNGKTIFLPADVGLTLDLDSQRIKAITTIDALKPARDPARYVTDYLDPGDVDCQLLVSDFSLHYHKKDASFEANLLSQMLMQDFHGSTK